MNAIFTYLTWTAKLRQAKKKKKVGITRHLDMIPGTLLPEHLPSFAWLVQPCKYCYEASKTCQRVTPPFHIRVHCPLGFIWALLGGFIFWAPETDLRKLLKLKRQNFTFLYIYIATKFVLNEVIFFFQFVFPSLPILCRLILFFCFFFMLVPLFWGQFQGKCNHLPKLPFARTPKPCAKRWSFHLVWCDSLTTRSDLHQHLFFW